MPARPHVLVTFGGGFGSGADAEIWQVGVKMGALSSDGNVMDTQLKNLTSYVNSIQGALSTWFGNATNLLRSDFTLQWLKAANIGAGTAQNPYGKYLGATDPNGGPNPGIYTYASPVAGGAAVASFPTPPIITVAATFRNTNQPRGPRHSASHGRIYLPFRLQTSTNRIGSPSAYVTAVSALLTLLSQPSPAVIADGIDEAAPNGFKPILVGVNGTSNVVNRVDFGDVVDTVRNRKSKLREVYTGAAWS
jgi:hypothetical protein